MINNYIAPGKHQLPPLPYPYNALEPVIGEKTLRIHHDKHHKGYVDGLNSAEMELVKARREGNYDLIRHWEREIAFNGSGHILHSIYWTIMSPIYTEDKVYPSTYNEIVKSFGSFENFKEQFISASSKIEGSGWGILVWNPAWRRLVILTAENHQNLTQWGSIPILVVDVWEHAYYLNYQNERNKYIESWWNLINWHEVERRLNFAMMGIMPLTINSI